MTDPVFDTDALSRVFLAAGGLYFFFPPDLDTPFASIRPWGLADGGATPGRCVEQGSCPFLEGVCVLLAHPWARVAGRRAVPGAPHIPPHTARGREPGQGHAHASRGEWRAGVVSFCMNESQQRAPKRHRERPTPNAACHRGGAGSRCIAPPPDPFRTPCCGCRQG